MKCISQDMFGEKLHYESQFDAYCNIAVIGSLANATPAVQHLCLCIAEWIIIFVLLFPLEGVAAIEDVHQVLPSGYWWSLLYGTVLLFLCFIVCLVRIKFFFFFFFKLKLLTRVFFFTLEETIIQIIRLWSRNPHWYQQFLNRYKPLVLLLKRT